MSENKKSPLRNPVVPWLAIATAGAAILGSVSAGKSRRQQARQNALAIAEQKAARLSLEKRIGEYEKSEFVPLDIDKLRQDNLFEDADMTQDVLPAADYAREQFAQQQANIMQGLRGAAGGSGIAGLAQSLSNQAAGQAKQQSISIGQQLSQNKKLAIQAQQSINDQERGVKIANMEGKNAFELDKMATLMGVSGQRAYAAGQSAASSQSNMIALQTAQAQANAQMWQTGVTALSQMNYGGGGGGGSTPGDYTMNQYTGGPGPTDLQGGGYVPPAGY